MSAEPVYQGKPAGYWIELLGYASVAMMDPLLVAAGSLPLSGHNMIDRSSRNELAQLLRKLAAGTITPRQFADEFESWASIRTTRPSPTSPGEALASSKFHAPLDAAAAGPGPAFRCSAAENCHRRVVSLLGLRIRMA